MKSIGTDFYINLNNLFSKKVNELKKLIYFSTGRDAINCIIDDLEIKKNDQVLLPAYLCSSIIDQFRKKNINVSFYKLNRNLEIDLLDLIKNNNKHTVAILIIHYFGFIQSNTQVIRKICNDKKIKLIEDLVQSYLTKYTPVGDYYFNSYRKFMGIVDGAFLGSKERIRTEIRNKKSIYFIVVRLLFLIIKKYVIFKNLSKKLYYYIEYGLLENKKQTKMSIISKKILRRANFEKIRMQRRKNYLYLLENLNNKKIKPLFNKLPETVTPLGFPIICENRNEIKQKLIKEKIYPPIHWNLPHLKDKFEYIDSSYISENILTIPIDQRYNTTNMKRIIEVLKNV